jgi:hypothetical protein
VRADELDVGRVLARDVLALLELQDVELPGLALGRDVEPALPALAVSFGLAPQELGRTSRTIFWTSSKWNSE